MQQNFRHVAETHDSFHRPLIIFHDERLNTSERRSRNDRNDAAWYAENDKHTTSHKTVNHAPVVTLVTGTRCTRCIIIESCSFVRSTLLLILICRVYFICLDLLRSQTYLQTFRYQRLGKIATFENYYVRFRISGVNKTDGWFRNFRILNFSSFTFVSSILILRFNY